MELQYANAEDFVSKRISLINEFDKFEEQVQQNLNHFVSYSAAELGRISGDLMARYLFLKELMGYNKVLLAGRKNKDIEIRVGRESRGEDKLFSLRIDSNANNIEPCLEMLSQSYQKIDEPKHSWLFGENTNSPSRVVNAAYFNVPFNTAQIVEKEKIGGLVSVALSSSPRASYDSGTYQMFKSLNGFDSVSNFCRRFPHQFTEAIIIADKGKIFLSPERDRGRGAGCKVTGYKIEAQFQDRDAKKLTDISKIVDECL